MSATLSSGTSGIVSSRAGVGLLAVSLLVSLTVVARFVFDTGSQLLASVHIDFSDPELDGMSFDIAVTGGTGDYFGACGVVTVTDISESADETVSLYEADLVLMDK